MVGPKKQDFCVKVTRISFDFSKWRSLGPQKLATIIDHKYSIVLKNKGSFFNYENKAKISKVVTFWGHEFQINCVHIS